jgi:hypothetical protein|tara:strand:- start:170 stop:409 length:240 start_codon:yes stop_codon:yes gene_type:complete
MCIICVELEKSFITPQEAMRNLSEVSETLTLEHLIIVEEKIKEIENKNYFIMLLKEDNTVESCTTCHCNPCDCDWGTNE